MRIGVTSQNFRTVTGHAGKARRFLVFQAETSETLREVERIDLPLERSLHNTHGNVSHPVDNFDVLITQSCGAGFVRKMAQRGVRLEVTSENDPVRAATALIEGRTLPPPQAYSSHEGCG